MLNLSVDKKRKYKGKRFGMHEWLFTPVFVVVVGLNKIYSHIVITNSTKNRYRKHRSICCCCNLKMFHDWRECVMSVLGTTEHS